MLEPFSPPPCFAGRTLDIIRHGQSTANAEGIVCGQMDCALSEIGLEQAESLAAKLPGYAPDLAFVSPLQRARQTIAPLGLVGVQRIPALMEVNTGDFSPMYIEKMWAEFPIYKYQGRAHEMPYPGGESLYAALARIWGWFISESLNWPTGSHVMLAGHEGTVCAILHGLLTLNLWAYPTFTIPHASLTRVTWDEMLHMRIALGHVKADT